jgi:hypothetical protein
MLALAVVPGSHKIAGRIFAVFVKLTQFNLIMRNLYERLKAIACQSVNNSSVS